MDKYFFNSVLRPFQDYFSSYETGQSVGGRKREIPEKKHLAHPQAEVGLSHMLPARGLNPHQKQRTNTDLFNTPIYPRSSFSRAVRIDDYNSKSQCGIWKNMCKCISEMKQRSSLHGSVNSPIFMRGMAIISTSFKEITMSTYCGCLIVGLVFSHLGFWSGNLFLIAPFPGLCLLL